MKRFLVACRHLLIVPIIGCVLLTGGVVIMGVGRIVTTGVTLARTGDFSTKAAKTISLAVIEIIDLFLVGTVAYIAAVGLYRLFIRESKIDVPLGLKIHSLKDLEDNIIGVIVAALAVAFLGQAVGTTDLAAVLNYGGGIALVIVALAFFMRLGGKESGPGSEK